MLSYDRLLKKPEIFRSFSGLEVSGFDSLYGKIGAGYEEHERKRLAGKDRKRDVGAGHPFKLELRDRLLMLLVYHRLYATSTLVGFLFDRPRPEQRAEGHTDDGAPCNHKARTATKQTWAG